LGQSGGFAQAAATQFEPVGSLAWVAAMQFAADDRFADEGQGGGNTVCSEDCLALATQPQFGSEVAMPTVR